MNLFIKARPFKYKLKFLYKFKNTINWNKIWTEEKELLRVLFVMEFSSGEKISVNQDFILWVIKCIFVCQLSLCQHCQEIHDSSFSQNYSMFLEVFEAKVDDFSSQPRSLLLNFRNYSNLLGLFSKEVFFQFTKFLNFWLIKEKPYFVPWHSPLTFVIAYIKWWKSLSLMK